MYPLTFKPVFQKRIWGGQRLRALLARPGARDLQGQPLGESWELADLPPGAVGADSTGAAADGSLSSAIANGPWAGKTLHEIWKSTPGAQRSAYFPLLVKFLDARQDLSVQVHPDAAYAAAHPGAFLKSESWYVIHAEPGAKIYKGVRPGVTREQFRAALEARDVTPLLHAIPVRAGDCHYLPSGTLHALGAGILAAEVQTPSDTTFRVFDWNRLGADGKPRKLHVAEALECIRFETPSTSVPQAATPDGERLVSCEHFTLDRVRTAQSAERALSGDQPVIWIVIEGQGVIRADDSPPTAFARGDTLLLLPGMKNARVKTVTDCTWLEARLPATAEAQP